MKPLADRVLVQKQEEEKKTASGLFIPETATEKPTQGKVLAVGKDVQELKVGDVVVFGKYAGTELKVGTESNLILKEEEVLAVLE